MVRKTRSASIRTASDDEEENAIKPLLESPTDSVGSEPARKPLSSEAETRRRWMLEYRHMHKVFFLRKELLAASDEAGASPPALVHITRLLNPANQCATHYICQHEQGRYYELVRYAEPNRSWLISDLITIDGTIYMTTLIDPLFLILPYVRRHCSQSFVPLDHALKCDRCPDIDAFAEALPMSQVLLVADQKGPADLRAVRYNEAKTLDWLAFKCDKYVRMLAARGVHIERGAKSETYVKSEKQQADPGDNARFSLALSLLNEYLPKALHSKLMERVGAELAKPRTVGAAGAATGSRPSSASGTSQHKRRPTSEAEKTPGSEKRAKETSGSSSDSPDTPGGAGAGAAAAAAAAATPKTLSTREKAMAKAAAGTKGILSFFKRK